MNVIFFVPFGMTFSSIFPETVNIKKRIIFTCIVGFLISVSVEISQYAMAVGTAEFDDLTCNTLGAFLGTLPLIIPRFYLTKNQ